MPFVPASGNINITLRPARAAPLHHGCGGKPHKARRDAAQRNATLCAAAMPRRRAEHLKTTAVAAARITFAMRRRLKISHYSAKSVWNEIAGVFDESTLRHNGLVFAKSTAAAKIGFLCWIRNSQLYYKNLARIAQNCCINKYTQYCDDNFVKDLFKYLSKN